VEEKNIDDYVSDRHEQMTKELARLRRDHAELDLMRRELGEVRKVLGDPILHEIIEEYRRRKE